MRLRFAMLASLVLLTLGPAFALADAISARFQDQKTPSSGAPRSIGDYSAGCLAGARALPLDGTGYQVMHPSRLRYFGNPALIDFLESLGRGVSSKQLGAILIGDLSQPRGGRAPGGHASHQTGLDVDIWYWRPKATQVSDAERESLKARSVLDAKAGTMDTHWASRVTELLHLTATDVRVERVFVHPIIKRELCAKAGDDRAWLSKIRPWYGHDDHFHVRLACPLDSPDCTHQATVPAGDGCDGLDYWFSEQKSNERKQGENAYQSKVVTPPKLPAQCAELVQ